MFSQGVGEGPVETRKWQIVREIAFVPVFPPLFPSVLCELRSSPSGS